MVNPNPLIGTGLHAIGGISAASCYTPFESIKSWSWNTFWLIQAMFAWLIMPMIIGLITVPDFFGVLRDSPPEVIRVAFILGAVYGFGGMSFGFSIRYIGFSLTYTIAIGISAVFGTLVPLIINGTMIDYFTRPGSNIVIVGMIMSIAGVGLSGWAGFRKERDLVKLNGSSLNFNMKVGLALAVIGGLLSAVFNISLEHGQPIADLAAQRGAGHFEGNAKIIVSTTGCLTVNLIWFFILSLKKGTLKEFIPGRTVSIKQYIRNFFLSMLAGTLWIIQFFFYGLGHVKMGNFQFISWVLHMSMLIFFSYIVGVLVKEWRKVTRKTYLILIFALITLVLSFVIMTYGSIVGERALNS
ncbi:MAG: rhamnose:proton symporter [Bacteroidales bacterium]|nr:rhamnose:proton symporter [Bacteroidales bacterium]